MHNAYTLQLVSLFSKLIFVKRFFVGDILEFSQGYQQYFIGFFIDNNFSFLDVEHCTD